MDPDLSFHRSIYLFSASMKVSELQQKPPIRPSNQTWYFWIFLWVIYVFLDLEPIQSGSQTILATQFRAKSTAWIRICEKYDYDDTFMAYRNFLRQLTFNKICPVVSILELIQIKNRVNEAGQGSQIGDGKTGTRNAKEFIKEFITK